VKVTDSGAARKTGTRTARTAFLMDREGLAGITITVGVGAVYDAGND